MNGSEISAMQTTARALVADEKGILAADESLPTIGRRFATVGIESTEDNRRAYREMLFTTPHIEEFISGVILFDETIRQRSAGGIPLINILRDKGIIPGIKVDRGTTPLALFPGETITEGIDGLRERLRAYRELGARFTKWRAVLKIGPEAPTLTGIAANAHFLACFAALSQEAGLVPIVEPEVLREGDHSMSRCEEVTSRTLRAVFHALGDYRVNLQAVILKPNMGNARKRLPRTDESRTDCGSYSPLPARGCTQPGARNRVPLRRAGRGRGNRAAECNQQSVSRTVASELFFRPGAAGIGSSQVERT